MASWAAAIKKFGNKVASKNNVKKKYQKIKNENKFPVSPHILTWPLHRKQIFFRAGLRLSFCEAVELSDRLRQKGQTNTSRTLDPLIEIVSTT